MNLKQLASHTVDLDLLKGWPAVLDVGCRDFDFVWAIYFERPQSWCCAMDPGPGIQAPYWYHDAFLSMALVGIGQPDKQRLFTGSTGHGDFLSDLPIYYDMVPYEVRCVDISQLMRETQTPFWDVVKLDCEGSEFKILETWPGRIARQISVEFHDWDKPQYREGNYYAELFAMLAGFGYKVVQHELSQQGNGVGHWDTLITL